MNRVPTIAGKKPEMGKSKQQLMQRAIEKADVRGLQTLLAQGADPNGILDDGHVPLVAAVSTDDERIVAALIDAGANPRHRNQLGMTALQYASSPKVAALLVAAGADVNATDNYGGNPLSSVASNGDATTVKWLLSQGAREGSSDSEGNNSLHRACLEANPRIVAALLEGGADPSARNKNGVTPLLYVAGEKGKPGVEIINLLLKAGADPNAQMVDGCFPLYEAATEGSPAAVEALLAGGALIDLDEGCGETALAAAVYSSRANTAAALLKAGANPQARISLTHEDPNRRGKSVLELATDSRSAAIRALFKSR